jgi:hypothetical protein
MYSPLFLFSGILFLLLRLFIYDGGDGAVAAQLRRKCGACSCKAVAKHLQSSP